MNYRSTARIYLSFFFTVTGFYRL